MVLRFAALRQSVIAAVLSCLIAGQLSGTALAADHWPQFRGPGGDGQAPDSKLAVRWNESLNVKWKTPIHGRGWSSPVVWDDQIWMTTATDDGKQMFAVCVDRHSGKVLHDVLVFENENPRFRHPTNSYASPTPVVEDGRVYVHFGSYGTACLDTGTAEVLWEQRDLLCNHWRGPGSSPIIHEDMLLVAFDGYDLQYVVGLNKNTGKIVWKTDRNIDYGTDNGDRMKAYSTGTVLEHAGRKQWISPSAAATIAYDPYKGTELWRVRHGGMNAAARPIYRHGLVYIAAGSGPLSLIAVRPDGQGDITETHVAWNLGKSVPKRPSPLLIGDLMFLISDQGVASCVDARTGQVRWQQRVRGNFRASPVFADGRIYLCSEEGRSFVIAAKPEFQLLAENDLDDGFQASPAVVGDSLYLRTTKHLYCIEAGAAGR